MSSIDTENEDPSPSTKKLRFTKSAPDMAHHHECTPNDAATKAPMHRPPSSTTIRSPLGTVAAHHSNHDLTLVTEPDFFIYRKPIKPYEGANCFDALSDEIILHIFKLLPKKTLMRLCLVCERFRQIVYTDVLWTRMDLAGRNFKSGAIGNVISRGVVILRLASSEVNGEILADTPSRTDWSTFQSKLQFLDLSMCTIAVDALETLLSKCRRLRKLSLEHVPVSGGILMEIAENTDLESLNLTMCAGIQPAPLSVMLKRLTKLRNLNVAWTYLSADGVTVLVKYVPAQILRLNVAGCKRTLTDKHLKCLVQRCRDLIELDVSDCVELTGKGVEVIHELTSIEFLSLSRCYNVDVTAFLSSRAIPSLRFFNIFGLMRDEVLECISSSFPDIGINKFIHSSVARPTVGTRRTSIWGLRTRD